MPDRTDFPYAERDTSRSSLAEANSRRDRSRRVRALALGLSLVGVFLIGGLVGAYFFGVEPPVESRSSGTSTAMSDAVQKVVAEAQQIQVPEDNPIARQAQTMGVSTCLARIVTLSEFLTGNTVYDYLAAGGTTDPDGELFTAAVAAKERPSGLAGISFLNAAPVAGGKCNTSYSSAIYFPQACNITHETLFKSFSKKLDFKADFVEAFSTANGSGMLFLLPAGAGGCVAVKSEILH